MRLGSTQRLVLDNVAARRAPYAGHRTHAEYLRRMSVARELEKRGLLASLPFGHPENMGLASMYRLTEAGQLARAVSATKVADSTAGAAAIGVAKKSKAQLDLEIRAASLPTASSSSPSLPMILPRDAESPELWPDAVLEAQVARYLRRWPGRHNSVRLFGAMMSELVERRRAGGGIFGQSDAQIEDALRVELGSEWPE